MYGPKPEEDYFKAVNFVLTGLPSDAAKDLRSLICDKNPSLKECCCAKSVGAKWRSILPPTVRAAVANMDLKTDFDKTVKHADYVFNAIKAAQPVALIAPSKPPTAGAAAASALPADLDTSADAPALDQVASLASEIAAFNKNFKSMKKQNQKGASNGRGAQQKRGGGQEKPKSRSGRADRHPDGPPENACPIHWKHGRSAFYCLTPSTCPWSAQINPPSK